MAAKKTPAKQSKSDFIRSQPSTMSAAEVVAKGKAAGIKILPGLVYEVRRTAKAKKGASKKSPTKKQSKADFVRAHGDLSAKEVVEKGKAAGVKLDVSYVYNVRAYSKAKAKKKSAGKARPGRNGLAVARPINSSSAAEALLKALGAELGLAQAIEILEGERARVRAVLGVS
jgi:hypothetical protein